MIKTDYHVKYHKRKLQLHELVYHKPTRQKNNLTKIVNIVNT